MAVSVAGGADVLVETHAEAACSFLAALLNVAWSLVFASASTGTTYLPDVGGPPRCGMLKQRHLQAAAPV